MADEPNELERLVVQRIRELLSEEGGLQRFLEGGRQIEAKLGVSGRIDAQVARVEAQFSGSGGLEPVVVYPEPAVLALRGAAPELAIDIEGRSPRDINLALNFYMAFWTTVGVLVTLWQVFHGQPLTLQQINQIFEQTTTVIHQTINMPPPSPPPPPPQPPR